VVPAASGKLRSASVNLTYFDRVCQTLFNGTSLANQDDLRRRFGGRHQNSSIIIFVNGAIDPWSTLSLQSEFNNSDYQFFSVRIETGSHCSELSPAPTDTDEIIAKRKYVIDLIAELLVNATNCTVNCGKDGGHGHCELGHCICDQMWGGENCGDRQTSAIIFQVSAAALVVLPAIMMIVIGCSAWFLFQKEVNEPDIGTMGTIGM
jgi:hypothetical protein